MTNISLTLLIAFVAVFLSSFVMAAISAGLTEPFLNRHFSFNKNVKCIYLFIKLLVCIQDLESFVNVCKSDHFILELSAGELLVSVPARKCCQLTRLISPVLTHRSAKLKILSICFLSVKIPRDFRIEM